MTKPKRRIHYLLPAIAAIAFGCAHQPASVAPPTGEGATQNATANTYAVQAWSGKKGGNKGGWAGARGGNKGGWAGNKGGNKSGWTGNRGGGGGANIDRGGNYGRNRGDHRGGGGWSDRHGGHHSYAYGHHWTHNYGWWGHNYRYDTAGWWGGGNWWTYGGVPWWGLGYEPAWLATASLAQSQFVYLNGFYYPFYYVGGTIYPDYSRPFVYNGYTYVPYSGANLMVPNQGESLPVSNAQIVNAPASVTD